jgi:hypothetical protein
VIAGWLPHQVIRNLVIGGWLFVYPASAVAQAGDDATRQWVLEQLHETLSTTRDMSQITSMLYGLVSDRITAQQPETRKVLTEVERYARTPDLSTLDCGEQVNLRLIANFLNMAGMAFDTVALDERLYHCLGKMNVFDTACALFSLCSYPSGSVTQEVISQSVKTIEGLQQADGSFGSFFGLPHYYFTTHAVFALHSCNGSPNVVQRGQNYLRNGLPGIQQAGFLDGLLESLIMLREMGVEIPNEARYSDYLRAMIKGDGSICHFDRPDCQSDAHASSLLLVFLREFGD